MQARKGWKSVIKVELIKFDPFTNKTQTRTWDCGTEEKARSKVSAQATVNKIHPSQISEERDAGGCLTKIVMTAGSPAPDSSASPRSISVAECPTVIPTADVASENEECARLTEKILGKNNNIALLIRARISRPS